MAHAHMQSRPNLPRSFGKSGSRLVTTSLLSLTADEAEGRLLPHLFPFFLILNRVVAATDKNIATEPKSIYVAFQLNIHILI